MSRGRTATIVVALILLISLGACSSGDSNESLAAADRSAAAQNRAAVVRARAAAANRRAATRARRLAVLRARRARRARLARQYRAAVTTAASTSFVGDLAAIQRTVNALNAAFGASVAGGIVNSKTANHWVETAVYTGDQCVAFETARGRGIVAEAVIVHPESLVAAPGWMDPVIGRIPQGRIYRMTIDEIQTLVTTGQQRRRSFPIHVTVQSNGSARLFLRCR